MPKNWKTYKLIEVADVIDSLHKTPKYSDFGYPMVRAQEIVGGTLDITNTAKVSKDVYEDFSKNHKSEIGDLVFSRVGAHCGKISYVNTDIPFCLGQNTAFILPKTIDNKFLYYLLKSNQTQEQLTRNAVVSSYKTISLKTLRELDLYIPDLKEQKAIANILSAIDDKIENNLAINKTLEDMAMALYKHWFVDFGPFQDGEFIDSELGTIPKGWEVKKLADCNKLLLGGTPARKNESYWQNGTIGWLNSGKVNEFRIVEPTSMITEEAVSKSSTKIMKAGTTVIAITGATLGQISRIEKEFCANQSVIGILESTIFTNEFIYLWMHRAMDELIKQSTGGAQQHVNKNDVGELEIIKPPENIRDEFQKSILEVFENIKINCFENQTLTKLRDTLLPKLISGEVRLKEFQEQVETVL